jgi:hypothetical protein
MPPFWYTLRWFHEGMDTAHRSSTRTAARLIVESALIAGALCTPAVVPAEPPPLLLANDYDDVAVDESRYWVSEKYDGVRA